MNLSDEKRILEDKSGIGTIYSGKYYRLDYQPARKSEHDLEVIGIELIIRRVSDMYAHDFQVITVFYKESVIYSYNETPFKSRLKLAIDLRIRAIKDKESFMTSNNDPVNKIINDQKNIDNIIKEVMGCEENFIT